MPKVDRLRKEKTNRRQGESVQRGLLLLMLSQAVFILSGYAIHIFIAKRLGPAEYGVFGFIIAVLTWLEILVYGCGDLAVVYSRYFRESFKYWKRLLLKAQTMITLACFLPSILFALSLAIKGYRYGSLFLIAFVDLLFIGYFRIYQGYLNGHCLYLKQSLASIAYSITKVGAIMVLILLGYGVAGALMGNVLSSVAGLVVGVYLLKSEFPELVREHEFGEARTKLPFRHKEASDVAGIAKQTLPFILVPLFYGLIMNLDLWAVKFICGKEEVGFYVCASSISRAIFFLFSASYIAIFPVAISVFGENTNGHEKDKVFQAMRDFFFVIALPLTIFLVINAKQVITILYGEPYLDAVLPMRLLCFAMLELTLMIFAVYMLYAAGKKKLAVSRLTVVSLADLILLVIFTKLWNMVGAAFTTMLIAFSGSVLLTNDLWQIFRIKIVRKRELVIMLVGLSFCIPLFILTSNAKTLSVYSLFSILLYFVVLRFMGIVSKEKFRFLFRSLKR